MTHIIYGIAKSVKSRLGLPGRFKSFKLQVENPIKILQPNVHELTSLSTMNLTVGDFQVLLHQVDFKVHPSNEWWI